MQEMKFSPAPYWTTYPEPIALAGATTTVLPTTEETGFRVTVDQLNASLTERTKALILYLHRTPQVRYTLRKKLKP